MCERRPRLLLADDHPLMLEGLRKLLETDFEVVGTVADGRALLEAAEILLPDLVITDISMPQIAGVEATRRRRDLVPTPRGLSRKDIARQLGVAVTTVRTDLTKVSDKLDSESGVELALYAAYTREAVM